MKRTLVMALACGTLIACGTQPSREDASIRDAAAPMDGPRDVSVDRLDLSDGSRGRCEPDEEELCGCFMGFRRCDTCIYRCPEGYQCNGLGLCSRPHYHPQRESGWTDECAVRLDDFNLNTGGVYCGTDQFCMVSPVSTGIEGSVLEGVCHTLDFCQAAPTADPPLQAEIKCIYSDGSDVVNGPPAGTCPPSDPRQPFCGGACGGDGLVCPLTPPLIGGYLRQNTNPCVGASEDRAFGVCAYGYQRCERSHPNTTALLGCELAYNEPCACLVTHPQLYEDQWEQGYVVLASVCRDYVSQFPGSTECRGANWSPLPPAP